MFQLKDKIKIQMLDMSKTTGVPMFGRVYEFQCLEGSKIINTMIGRI